LLPHPWLPSTSHWVLTAAHEQPGRLDQPVCDIDFNSIDYSLTINGLESFALCLFCLGNTFLFLFWKGLVSLLFLFLHLSFFICKLVSHRKVYVLYCDVVVVVVVITLWQEFLEVAQEIFLEGRILDVMSVLFLCP